jgi:hypothetical protein
MQFYIVDPNPEKNIKLLPEYAIKKVNVREGWQILSDIGHMYNVTWEGQNKLYSASHVLTRSFCVNAVEYLRFINHYVACVYSYKNSWQKRYETFLESGAYHKLLSAIPDQRTSFEYQAEYMLKYKSKHLTEQEKINLINIGE